MERRFDDLNRLDDTAGAAQPGQQGNGGCHVVCPAVTHKAINIRFEYYRNSDIEVTNRIGVIIYVRQSTDL